VQLRRSARQLPHHYGANPQEHQDQRQHELQVQRRVILPPHRYNYYIVKDGNILYVCLADSSLKVKTAVVFLDEIKKKFKEKFPPTEIATAGAFDMNASFAEIYKQQFVTHHRLRPSSTATRTRIKRMS
jgi:hypothetical protein